MWKTCVAKDKLFKKKNKCRPFRGNLLVMVDLSPMYATDCHI